ncbi:MAG: phytoene/squalene synthase family protein [Halieaceae bacterium]|nr:phytoene/squalene synthase family protein [Halieaceae bacterium]
MPQPHTMPSELPTPRTDLSACRSALSTGSRSFWIASQLLPERLKNAACGLYAFCREADDAIDEGGDAERALLMLKQRLDDIYAGRPQASATDRVLCQVVNQHHLPRELLDALLEGFRWDAQGRRYDSLSALYAYSARVAGTVGVMMTLLMGVRDQAVLARAADLGVAMQLTNIARDVGEDARAGRLYLPLDTLNAVGLDPADFLAAPVFSPAVAVVIESLLTAADSLYARSRHGLSSLPWQYRQGILAAGNLYAGIGHQLRRLGHNSIDQRSILSSYQKFQLLMQSMSELKHPDDQLSAPPLPEVRFLLDAVRHHPAPSESQAAAGNAAVNTSRTIWMLELFAALEERPGAQQRRS